MALNAGGETNWRTEETNADEYCWRRNHWNLITKQKRWRIPLNRRWSYERKAYWIWMEVLWIKRWPVEFERKSYWIGVEVLLISVLVIRLELRNFYPASKSFGVTSFNEISLQRAINWTIGKVIEVGWWWDETVADNLFGGHLMLAQRFMCWNVTLEFWTDFRGVASLEFSLKWPGFNEEEVWDDGQRCNKSLFLTNSW